METVTAKKSSVTQNVADYISYFGISMRKMAQETGLSYEVLRASLSQRTLRNRPLRDDEFIKICKYLQKNPLDFVDED